MPESAHQSWMYIAPGIFFLYYAIVWICLGRNPAPATVMIRYTPPDGLSPAAVRYVRTGGSDFRSLAAVIAQLASRKCLSVQPLGGSRYKLTRLQVDDATLGLLAPEELRQFQIMFDDGPEFVVDTSRGTTLNMFASVLQEKLQKRLGSTYVSSHVGFVVLGVFLSMVTTIVFALVSHPKDALPAVFLAFWFFCCGSIIGLITVVTVIPTFVRAARGLGGIAQAFISVLVIAAFSVGFFFVLRELSRNSSRTLAIVIILLVAVHPLFAQALRRVTKQGRIALDQIEGFREFLLKVEQDRMKRIDHAGEASADELKYLPYAIALEIREAWGDHLANAVFGVPVSR